MSLTEILFYSTIQSAQINEEFIRPSLPLHKYRVTILHTSSGLQAGAGVSTVEVLKVEELKVEELKVQELKVEELKVEVLKVEELKVEVEVEEFEEPTPCHPHSP